MIEFYKQEITGHTSALHEKKVTTLHEMIIQKLQEIDASAKTFKLHSCNNAFTDCGDGIYKIEYACILDPRDAYGESLRFCTLDVMLHTNKYGEFIGGKESFVKVTKRK